MPDAKSLEAVIEEAFDPIEDLLEKGFRLVHEHGAREEREAVVRWLRDQGPMGSALADDIEAGEHRKP